jgi:hypothetical protein
MEQYVKFSSLIGKTLTSIDKTDDSIMFYCEDGDIFHMFHSQDCCESVTIDDVVGDLNDLIGSPIVNAEEASSEDGPKDGYEESFTWTFYHVSTTKGTVTIKWYGSSNGYYSESVEFAKQ